MSYIAAVASANAPNSFSLDEIRVAGQSWLQNSPKEFALFERLLTSSKNKSRHFAIPLSEILSLNGAAHRAARFESLGPDIAIPPLFEALESAKIDKEKLGSFIFTSCTCPTIPSIDGLIIKKSGIPRSIHRVPIYQYGCAGGVAGLGLGWRLANKSAPVVLVTLELCSLVFQPSDKSGSGLVGSAIFADGAAAVVIDPNQGEFEIIAHESLLLPESRDLMGYDIQDSGTYLRLDRDLPSRLRESIRGIVGSFLSRHELAESDISWWLFHPGGVKILDYLEATFELPAVRCSWARDVLSDTGNLSSATILFVLKRFMDSQVAAKGDYSLMLGIGPGLSVELLLMRKS